ncbi:hypothetical protein L0F63_003650 [Massospora cicadina]|nr:hypothetical protein L0F63_003650 [Massospora cicadina]
MVTFTSDYWAPGLDVNVRRRPSNRREGPSNLASYNELLTPHLLQPNHNLSAFLQVDGSLSDTDTLSPKPHASKPRTKPPKDKRTNSPTSNHGSDSDFLGSVRVALSGIVSTKLARQKSQSSNGRNKEDTLAEKYGVCERRCIGKGATAVVRLAHKHCADKDTLYAVKAFRKQRKGETEREYVKKLTSEFCISSTLHHPNVVETVDLIKDEHGDWCEVMEYCPGGDLYAIIRNGSMTRCEIDCCFKQLITGVGYLHSMGVAHRDIKPENLLLDARGQVKITDFGVSDVFRMGWETAPHRSSGLCGSEPYIPPEAFIERDYDARLMDVWACGIVYYTMTFHTIPFRSATPNDPDYRRFLELRALDRYEPFLRYAPGCRSLMRRILEPDVAKRATVQDILEDAWFKSIEVCNGCEAASRHHNHYAASYAPRRPAVPTPIPPQPSSSHL